MQHDHIQIYFYFYSNPQVENVCIEKVCACIMVCICFIPFYFDIQHDHVLKKLNFDFFLPPPPPPPQVRGGGWGSLSFVFKHNFHVDAGRMIVKCVKFKEMV